MYADDTVIYVSRSSVEMIKEHLQEDIYCVEQWMYENQLLFNQEKTKCMLFGTRHKLANVMDFELNLQGVNISRVTEFCYLGVILGEQLFGRNI